MIRRKGKKIKKSNLAYILDKPVEHSNMKPSFRRPNPAAFPLATQNKMILT